MSRSRWSISNALRQVRGARSAACRAAIRYSRNGDVWVLLEAARGRLDAVEAELLDALTKATAVKVVKRRAA